MKKNLNVHFILCKQKFIQTKKLKGYNTIFKLKQSKTT
jgi:hypothetical protein